MRCKKYLFPIWTLICTISAQAQCPVRDTLWQRIDQLANVNISEDSQLNELLHLDFRLKECKTPRDSADAYLYQRLGVMYYGRLDYSSSVKYTLAALEILNDLQKKGHTHQKQKFRCYRNLCIYYDSLRLTGKKSEATDSCISIGLTSTPVDSLVLYPICDKMVSLISAGDYTRCVQYGSLGKTLAEEFGYIHSDIIKRILAWKIDALRLLNDFPRMAEELKNKIQEYEHSGNYEYVGSLYGLWADYYLGTNKIDSALLSYRKSFQFEKKMKNIEGCASSLTNTGIIYYQYLNDYQRALNFYFKALPYSTSAQSINIYTNIGNVYIKKQAYDSAYYYYHRAFDQIYPGMNEDGLLNSRRSKFFDNIADYIATLVLDKADAHLTQYKSTGQKAQLEQTLGFYRKADQLLDKMNQNQFEMNSKLTWRKTIRRLYEHAIEACWLDNNVSEGFYFFEKSRAVLLDDQLKQDRLMQNQDASERFQLKKSINNLERVLDTLDPKSDRYSTLQADLLRKKEEQDRLQISIRTKDPLYFARNPNEQNLRIEDLQNPVFKDYSALVEIFDGDSSVFILVITRTDAHINKISKTLYDSLSKSFLSFISNPGILNSQYNSFRALAANLYQMIFPDRPLPPGRIIISPDGVCIPFEALITNKDAHYMLNDYSISYTYSARFLMSGFVNSSEGSSTDFMGIAPVHYEPYLNLASLPGSDISLRQIQSHFKNSYTLSDTKALKSSFLENFSSYKIVQLYSHASYSDISGEPVIYFTDSSLYLKELFSRSRPSTRLVVLSACETALGQDYKGEGVFSFSRGFASLGIPATVSNLWSVDNESTYRITELFYEYVSEGLTTDIALQRAKLKFIKNAAMDKTLPFYWASPILTGKAEIIKTKSGFPLRYGLWILGLTAIIFFILSKLMKGRHNLT